MNPPPPPPGPTPGQLALAEAARLEAAAVYGSCVHQYRPDDRGHAHGRLVAASAEMHPHDDWLPVDPARALRRREERVLRVVRESNARVVS